MAMVRRVSLFEREVTIRLAPAAVDLATTQHVISDPPDASTAQRIAFLYASDERCREHARRIAVAEARRAAGCDLTMSSVDVESRAKGAQLHLSLNVEAQRERRTP